jgi:hypothetical protein
MTSPYRSNVSFTRLVDDCWETLQGKRSVSFPLGSRAAPSNVVFVFPRFDVGYYWELWDQVIAPTLLALSLQPPTCLGGWNNLSTRTTVEAALLATLNASDWAAKVDFTS